MAQKSAENLVAGVASSKNIAFERVLFAIGIRYVGETVAKKLAKHFKSIDSLMAAGFQELVEVDEIGDRIAQSVIDFFVVDDAADLFSPVNASGERNREIIARLKSHNLQLAVSAETLAGQTSILSGNTFVVSGVFTKISRTELKKVLKITEVKYLAAYQVKQHMWLLEIIWDPVSKLRQKVWEYQL